MLTQCFSLSRDVAGNASNTITMSGCRDVDKVLHDCLVYWHMYGRPNADCDQGSLIHSITQQTPQLSYTTMLIQNKRVITVNCAPFYN